MNTYLFVLFVLANLVAAGVVVYRVGRRDERRVWRIAVDARLIRLLNTPGAPALWGLLREMRR